MNRAPVFAQDIPRSPENARLGLLQRMTKLLGKKVGDRNERTVGKLEDVIIDLRYGRVPLTLVSAGTGHELTILPAQNYAYLSTPKLVLGVDHKSLHGAPHVPRANPLRNLNAGIASAACAHFSVNLPEECLNRMREMNSGSGLIGAPLLSNTHELLGHVVDIMVDLPLGRAVYLVVQPVSGGGQTNLLYVIPPVVAQSEAGGATLLLNSDRARFLAGPHFQSEFWTDMAFPELAAAVRTHYNLACLPAAPEAQISSARPESSGAPAIASRGRSDKQITQAILAEIVHDAAGFRTISISVSTVNGKVRLAGKVKNEKQRKLLVLAAERVVGADDVDDQIETGARVNSAQL
jgi:sporulation protein YlmC with PRC-barrel domain